MTVSKTIKNKVETLLNEDFKDLSSFILLSYSDLSKIATTKKVAGGNYEKVVCVGTRSGGKFYYSLRKCKEIEYYDRYTSYSLEKRIASQSPRISPDLTKTVNDLIQKLIKSNVSLYDKFYKLKNSGKLIDKQTKITEIFRLREEEEEKREDLYQYNSFMVSLIPTEEDVRNYIQLVFKTKHLSHIDMDEINKTSLINVYIDVRVRLENSESLYIRQHFPTDFSNLFSYKRDKKQATPLTLLAKKPVAMNFSSAKKLLKLYLSDEDCFIPFNSHIDSLGNRTGIVLDCIDQEDIDTLKVMSMDINPATIVLGLVDKSEHVRAFAKYFYDLNQNKNIV